mmetsp:Transcript_9586/g.27636  ORF Transcript_9586/g.27636 Transcript_9586/m.27636 type:complete len:213 (+) Transcript_9586:3815-4453(+)
MVPQKGIDVERQVGCWHWEGQLVFVEPSHEDLHPAVDVVDPQQIHRTPMQIGATHVQYGVLGFGRVEAEGGVVDGLVLGERAHSPKTPQAPHHLHQGGVLLGAVEVLRVALGLGLSAPPPQGLAGRAQLAIAPLRSDALVLVTQVSQPVRTRKHQGATAIVQSFGALDDFVGEVLWCKDACEDEDLPFARGVDQPLLGSLLAAHTHRQARLV